MKVITLLNEKGGVGKTTLSTHIAAGLAIRGARVMYIDADPQANGTRALGLPKLPKFHDLVVRSAKWQESAMQVHPDVFAPPNKEPEGMLFAVPSDVETRNIANTISDGLAVKKRFHQLNDTMDFIVVDTSPTPSLLHSSILLATDYVLLPTECEAFSFDGLADSILHNRAAQNTASELQLPPLQIMGIIPTMYRPKTVTHSEALKVLKQQYGKMVWPPIINRIIWAEAAMNNQLIFSFDPASKAAADVWQIIDHIHEVVHE